MTQDCPHCGSPFLIHDDEKAFLQKMTFTFGDAKIHPPEPVFCPECRMLFRTCHRNERTFYKRKTTKSKQDTVSLYADEPLWGDPFTVYTEEEWRSDEFDPLEYGRDFDFSRPFFDQFAELVKAVPRMNLCTVSNENSPYTTGTGYCKNCHLINSSEYCEDCYHSKLVQSCKDSVDSSYLYDSELCYGCFSVYKSYNCQYLLFSQNCQDCFYSSNLNGCKHCLLCTNLHQKEYHYKNKPIDKDEFEKHLSEIRGSYAAMQKALQELLEIRAKTPQKCANIVNSENCSGDYIENSKNCHDCYDMNESEDCRYVQVGVKVKDNYDCSNMYIKPELCYEVLGTIEIFNCAYCIFVFNSQNLLYCDYCYNCNDCFGCSGLTRKKFCIFNKQYTEEQYNALVPKIIEHMKKNDERGKYFPSKYAPFGYNETLAFEYIPLTKEEALKRGFLWRDNIDQIPKVEKTIPADRLPDNIDDIPDDILNWAITCEATKRPFQIIKQEFAYYRKHKIPIPHLHPDERHRLRMGLRNPRKLWERECGKCRKIVESTFEKNRPEKILCKECYLAEVY